MAKTLVIAEKYQAACDIADALKCTEKKDGYIEGDAYIITWADGHLIGYVYPEEYNPEYKEWKLESLPLNIDTKACLKVLPGKEKQFEIVKKLIRGSETDLIINAGDAGREGYLIQHRIYEMAGNTKPVKVLWASATTEEAILEAFANLHDDSEFQYILEEAEARADDDYIRGMNYSRLLTLRCSNDSTLPYGRCMTSLTNLVVQREKEIAEFQPTKQYTVEIEYENGMKGTIVDVEGKGVAFSDKNEALSIKKELSESTEGIVESLARKQIKEKAPELYNLPRLQAAIGKKYKYEPDKTLRIAQKLYEKHILSYPRTDSNFLPLSMKESVTKNLESCCFGKFRAALERARKDELEAEDRHFSDRDIKDHYALIPTVNKAMSHIYMTLSEEEKNVFDEIVYRFLGIFCKERITESVTIQVFVDGYSFRTTESVEIEPGYRLLKTMDADERELSAFLSEIEPHKENKITLKEIHVKESVSSAPPRYTVGTIIELMEKYHIGTPATMAATIEKLLDSKRPFLVLENGKYYATPFGRMYISVIPEELKDPNLTEQIEWKLQQIREGKMTKEEMLEESMRELQNNLERTDFKRVSFERCVKVKKKSRANYKRGRRTFLE